MIFVEMRRVLTLLDMFNSTITEFLNAKNGLNRGRHEKVLLSKKLDYNLSEQTELQLICSANTGTRANLQGTPGTVGTDNIVTGMSYSGITRCNYVHNIALLDVMFQSLHSFQSPHLSPRVHLKHFPIKFYCREFILSDTRSSKHNSTDSHLKAVSCTSQPALSVSCEWPPIPS